MMRLFNCVGVIFLSFLLLGCHLLSAVHLSPIQTYSLAHTDRVFVMQNHHSPKTLLVNLPTADPGFDSSKMMYELTPYDLRSYAEHQWIAPPSYMLMPLLADALRAEDYFKAVIVVPFSGVSDYYLDTRIINLTQNFLQPVSQEELTLQETLVNALTNQIIASKQFSIAVPAPGNNAYAGVVAANHATHILRNQIAHWVVISVQQ